MSRSFYYQGPASATIVPSQGRNYFTDPSSIQGILRRRKMKSLKRIFALLFVLVFLSACGSKVAATPFALQFDNPYAPQSGDITVDSASVLIAESQPPQLM